MAELGIVGLVLFLTPFVLVAAAYLRCWRRNSYRLSPTAWAAAAGMAAFAVSSMFSSFSFRSAQNGAVFFVVLAIGIREITKDREKPVPHSSYFAISAYAAAWLVGIGLAVFCGTRALAEYHAYRAEKSGSSAAAASELDTAISLDSEYAGAYLAKAYRAAGESLPGDAAPFFRAAIDNGIGTVPTFVALARQQYLAHQIDGADSTYLEGLAIYPRSVFLRASYAIFLEKTARLQEGKLQLGEARKVNERQANGWYELMRNGSMKALLRSRTDPTAAAPAELTPQPSVRQFLDTMQVEDAK